MNQVLSKSVNELVFSRLYDILQYYTVIGSEKKVKYAASPFFILGTDMFGEGISLQVIAIHDYANSKIEFYESGRKWTLKQKSTITDVNDDIEYMGFVKLNNNVVHFETTCCFVLVHKKTLKIYDRERNHRWQQVFEYSFPPSFNLVRVTNPIVGEFCCYDGEEYWMFKYNGEWNMSKEVNSMIDDKKLN
ncbi:MAG: hypothetical protein Sylvanvirus3_9 [Sylvanvirus sp.]|uniref:Uncharacterized protein n=1 Tax=Sylvanvirus sp. TaxID=2487774 RepID=A0A3G5AH74_9VIRU|nr:MAG: hypothetical protein Sylvanvirus3_9 [Sylvanvirus sp.]